jgi:mono/diheme cytochrome c family protein
MGGNQMQTTGITAVTLAVATLFLAALAGCAPSRQKPEPAAAHTTSIARGKLLHDTKCIACHDSTIYTRGDRLAKSYAQVREQVGIWQAKAGLLWSSADIDDATRYVNDAFYKYECPTSSC